MGDFYRDMPFWIDQQMVRAKWNGAYFVFDRDYFLGLAAAEAEKYLPPEDQEQCLRMFTAALRGPSFGPGQELAYKRVASLMLRLLRTSVVRGKS